MQKIFVNNEKRNRKRSQSRSKLDESFQANRKSGLGRFIDQNIYDVIIIGAGISGLLAAEILLR